jgi:hypothetical protein
VELSAADRPQESAEEFMLELSAAETPFHIEGDFYLRTRSGVKHLKIQSVPAHIMQPLVGTMRPPRPKLNDSTGQPILDDEELGRRFPKYKAAYERWSYDTGYAFILLGTQHLRLFDAQHTLVWDSDQDSSQFDFRRARKALEDMQLANSQWVSWYNAIRTLSEVADQEAQQDFLTDSADI